jgi:hypothetical protein
LIVDRLEGGIEIVQKHVEVLFCITASGMTRKDSLMIPEVLTDMEKSVQLDLPRLASTLYIMRGFIPRAYWPLERYFVYCGRFSSGYREAGLT